jgi:hypothetical protein
MKRNSRKAENKRCRSRVFINADAQHPGFSARHCGPLSGDMAMNTNAMTRAAFAALVLTTLGLAACSGPTLNGPSDAAQIFPGGIARPTAPYDNTANSLGGGWAGGGG